jgi:hypothetical protein
MDLKTLRKWRIKAALFHLAVWIVLIPVINSLPVLLHDDGASPLGAAALVSVLLVHILWRGELLDPFIWLNRDMRRLWEWERGRDPGQRREERRAMLIVLVLWLVLSLLLAWHFHGEHMIEKNYRETHWKNFVMSCGMTFFFIAVNIFALMRRSLKEDQARITGTVSK